MTPQEKWNLIISTDWSKLNVYSYMRVSSEEQAEKGMSMDAQRMHIENFLKPRNPQSVKYFSNDEGKSAAHITGRNDYQAILKELSAFDVILVTKLDRWSRSLSDFIPMFDKLQKQNVILYAIDEPIIYNTTMGLIMLKFRMFMSDIESQLGSQRMKDIHRAMFEKGRVIGNPPLGYSLVGEKPNKQVVINQEQAKKVSIVFEKTIQGIHYLEISKLAGIHPNQYLKILRNKTYCGILEYKGEEGKANFEPIISKETWDLANKKYLSKK